MPIPGFNEPKPPEGLRAFDDAAAVRDLIYGGVLDSLKRRFPMSDGKHRLELTDLRYTGPQDFPLSAQKRALMSNRNLSTPITGKWKLIDEATGGTLDEKEDTVMHVPYYTDRGTIIHRGNEYVVVNQSRLKPGVYTRTKQSGEHEAHYNILPGTGMPFRLWMEPATGLFRVNVGQANIPAYQFFQALGIPDGEMQKAWGRELFLVNRAKTDKQALPKLYQRFAGSRYNPDATEQDMTQFLRDTMAKSTLNEEVVARTMGLPGVKAATPQLLLRSTQKLLNISRGEEQEDDREAPQYSDYYGPEDFFKERIDKDAGMAARNLLFKFRRDGNLKRLGHAPLNSYIQSLILGSGLVQTQEETNPLQTLDQQNRIIKLGEGGISSAEAVIDEARDVHSGQAGFIDPIAGPESEKIGIDMRAARRTFKGPDKQIYGEFLDTSGKPIYLTPLQAADKALAFSGQDPKAPELYAIKDGRINRVPRDEVDAFIPSNSHMYGSTINLVPMNTGFMPSRAFYAAKYWSQYLPVVGGEAPLVQPKMPGTDRSFFEYYGRKVAALNSKVAGTVSKVTDDGISIIDEDGKKHFIETVKDLPFNRQTACSYKAAVKVGDQVNPGDLLATSNFTDEQGNLAMGKNLKTAVIPARGHSFEDAVVISESAAKKMTTERLYGIDKESRNGVQISRNRFISAFPSKYTKDQVANIDDNGVVKVGTIVNKGDPIVLAVGPKALSSADAELGRLHKALRNAFRDEAIEWDYATPGEVVDVGRTTTGIKCNIKAQSPAQVGDKVSNLEASKGVIGCYDSETEIFTRRGWVKFPELLDSDDVLAYFSGPTSSFVRPKSVIRSPFSGELLGYNDKLSDWLVTPNHRMFCRGEHYRGTTAQYRYRSAQDAYGKRQYHLTAIPVRLSSSRENNFRIPKFFGAPKPKGRAAIRVFSRIAFAELLGWWLAEGSTSLYLGRNIGRKKSKVSSYKIQISQSESANPDKCQRIKFILGQLGLRWTRGKSQQYTFSNKPLYCWLRQFGLGHEKYIPEEVFTWDRDELLALWSGLMLGDGSSHTNKDGTTAQAYKTTSVRLAIGVDRLAALLGFNAVIQNPPSCKSGRAHQRYAQSLVQVSGHMERGTLRRGWYKKQYQGMIYCVDVGGGVVYVRRKKRPFWCGNSIVPDDEMPRDQETGEPYELLLNPMVVQSRVAPNQLAEMQLAKVAKKTGKPYLLPDEAPEEGWAEFARQELAKNGMKATKEIYDPVTGRVISPVGEGYMYVSAFHHLAEKKLCVSADTEVLTLRGWLPAPEVMDNDLVASLNPETGQTEFHRIRAVQRYTIFHSERLIAAKGNDRDELVTAGHLLYIDGKLVPADSFLEDKG